MNKRIVGSDKEELAEKLLKRAGYEILNRNYRCKMGEIDIIALKGRNICFVEVKYRSDNSYGGPLAAVDYHKQVKISRVADYYRMCNPWAYDYNVRFDVVAILGNKYKIVENAFYYRGHSF